MSKWADYVIVGVNFKKDDKKHILEVKICEDIEDKLVNEKPVSRQRVIEFLERDLKIITSYIENKKWKRGDDVGIVSINNTKFIRTDGNSTEEDNLGKLPEF